MEKQHQLFLPYWENCFVQERGNAIFLAGTLEHEVKTEKRGNAEQESLQERAPTLGQVGFLIWQLGFVSIRWVPRFQGGFISFSLAPHLLLVGFSIC